MKLNPFDKQDNESSSSDAGSAEKTRKELESEIERLRSEKEEAEEKVEELRSEVEKKESEYETLETSVGRLATVVMANAEGDLNVTPKEPDCEAAERIYKAYDDLIHQWRDNIDKMTSFSDQVGSATNQVDSKIDSVKEASHEVSTAVEDISSGSARQKDRIQNISGKMRGLSSTIQEIAASADEVADISREAAERGSSAQDSATEAMDELDRLTEHAETTVDNVERLNELLEDIEDIVEFITDIANKTNILALNANVEAARAGEAGEGFTVVADEVKNLASDTKEATNEIEKSIRRVHDQAGDTVDEMHETRETVGATHDAVEEALNELDKVVEKVNEVDQSVQEIDDATDSQAESTDDVLSMVEEVGDISVQTADQASTAADAARGQTTGLAEVSTRVSTLTDRAESLEETLDQYKLSRDRSSDEDSTVIEFWHAMGGQKGVLLEELAQEFESQHEDISIRLLSKGSYRGTLESTLSAAENGKPPAIAQIFEIGTTRARESGLFKPAQNLLPEDHISSLLDQVTNYYRFDGTLHSVPFNASNPVLAYNKEAFKQADLDVENPPGTFEEVKEAAEKIVEEDVSDFGITFATYSWFVEQWFAEADETLVNNDNGRSGTPTETNLNNEFAQNLLEWWKSMEEKGLYHNPGIVNRGGAKKKFHEGESAMLVGSTSSLTSIKSEADFEVATGKFPVRNKRTGVLVGGASLWVGADLPDDVHDAAAKFLTWLTKPEQQKRWHRETGYFPVHEDAIPQLRSDGWFEDNPVYKTAFDQLTETKDTIATRGAQIGPFDTVRTIIEDGIEGIDTLEEVESGLDRLDSQVQKKLESYDSDR